MSTYKVPYTTVLEVNPHPNADRLELLTIYGFQVASKKGMFQVGEHVFFIPVDSILPQPLEDELFPLDAKIKLTKHRVRQIRIRGFPSQGMVIDPEVIQKVYHYNDFHFENERDYAEDLAIVKYEPPEPKGSSLPQNRNKPKENPRFHKYGGLDNLKWYPTLFKEGEEVIVQEKLHGTNCRASMQPTSTNNLFRKFLKLIRMLPQYEFCFGSNNVQLQQRDPSRGFYGKDVYGSALEKADAKAKIRNGETIYGEIVGRGIQNNYEYGITDPEFVLFDVKVTRENGDQEYLNPEEVEDYAVERGFKMVPVLYRGPYVKEFVEQFVSGPSVFYNKEPVREGICIKSRNAYFEPNFGGKKALKWINPEYLDDVSNTDAH